MISTDCPSIKEIVEKEDIGLVYQSEKVGQLVEAILKIYNDSELKDRFHKNGKKSSRC